MTNAQRLPLPARRELNDAEERDRLEKIRQERLRQLEAEGWIPSKGWLMENRDGN